MFSKRLYRVVFVGLFIVLALLPAAAATAAPADQAATVSVVGGTVTKYAGGLENPRGLKFDTSRILWVAEGGLGGKQSTVGQCEQVPDAGPYTGSRTGSRISRILPNGRRFTFSAGYPSSQTNPQLGSQVSGVADIAFLGPQLYAVTAGSGCSHGVAGTSNGVFRVLHNGTWVEIANMSAYVKSHPVAQPNAGDFEPDGTFYSMLAVGGFLYTIEPNHGELDRISATGQVSRLVDISKTQGHIVPTAMTYRDGFFYVGNLGTFEKPNSSRIMKIDMQGNITPFDPNASASPLNAVTGVAFDPQGRLYVLEASAAPTQPGPPIIPGTGRVLRWKSGGGWEEVVKGLTFPSAMTFGPDGNLYISNFGFGFPPGQGEILRVHFAG